MSNAFSGENPGFVAWQLSQQVSHVQRQARGARTLVDEAVARGERINDEVRELLQQIEADAARARWAWRRVRDAVADSDPDLIESSDPSVAVIHNRAKNAELTNRIKAVWHEDEDWVEGVDARLSQLEEDVRP